MWCGVVWCGVVWCGVVWCGVVWCGVVWCGVVWCGVLKALLPEGNGRDVYPRVQVNGRAVCLSARCVLVCCCIAGPVHSCTWPVLLCRRLCPVTQGLVGPLHRVCRAALSVLSVWCCTAWCCALHCVCPAALHLWAEGSGLWNSCNALPHRLEVVGSGTPAVHRLSALGQWAVQSLQCTASPPGGSGQRNSCLTLPHCLGAVGSGALALHRHTA